MGLRTLFQQNSTYNASDLRALIDALGPQTIDENGAVAKGLEVSYGSNQLRVAAGAGFITANNATTGANFVVVNTADDHAAQNVSGGSTTWSPANPGPRTDIVYLQVDDKALDGDPADATTAYFATNTTTLPNESCILLAHVVSSGGTTPPTILDMRRAAILSPMVTGNTPMVITNRTDDWTVASTDWVALPFEQADIIDYRTFTVNVSDNWSMHRVSNTPITAPYSGWYEIGIRASWAVGAANDVHAVGYSINEAATVPMAQADMDGNVNGHVQNATMIIHLDVEDSFRFMVRSTDANNQITDAHGWARLLSYD